MRGMPITLVLSCLLFVSGLAKAQDNDISGGVTFDIKDAPVKVVKSVPVVYPQEYIDQGIEGSVQLMVYVNADGSLGEIKIKEPMEIEAFNQSAIEAIQAYEFSPAITDGEAVGSWIDLTINFEVKEE